MNTKPTIPTTEARARSVKNMREVNQQFDLAMLMLDEAISIMDHELLAQRRARLEKRASADVSG
jgi:hypothetical protein